MNALVENVIPRCGCAFSEDRIMDRVFQCFPSSPQSVTYHAQLHGTLNANASELFTAMQEWLSSGVTIPVQFLPLKVSSVCAVSSRMPLEDCPGEMTTDLPETTSSSDASNTTVIVTVSVVIVLAILVLAVTVLIIAIVYNIRHRQSAVNFKAVDNRLVVLVL